MTNVAYNLFLYVNQSSITEIGIAPHTLEGTDSEKLSMLQARVQQDCQTASRIQPSIAITWRRYEALMRLGRQLEIFEPLFQVFEAPRDPLVVITPVINGTIPFLMQVSLAPLRMDDLRGSPYEQPGRMVDYLTEYQTEKGFDLPRLLDDDYFKAMKLLFNSCHYVSAAKLLMSFIDTVAFIDLGDDSEIFCRWLDDYANLTELGITSKELWEFRNSILHMTNLHSRKVLKGTVVRLIFYVGDNAALPPKSADGEKYFNLRALVDAIASAVSRWIDTFNQSPGKWADFVERYDLTISDSRVSYRDADSFQA